MTTKNKLSRNKILAIAFAIVALLLFWFSVSFPLFNVDYSTVIYSRNNELMGAHVARDGQWRFPKNDSVPHKFVTSLLMFEDEYFYKHPGVNPFSIARAVKQNIQQQRVVSGGSTITMQVIRLSKQRNRNIWSKIIESIQALRIELKFSKKQILSSYAAHAPFGGNVVGLEAASWRYFQRPSNQLSWGESAMLAVLPNAPGLIHTGKNRNLLLNKRNFLLKKLLTKGKIDSLTYQLSIDEPIPQHPYALPQQAPHLLDYFRKKDDGKSYKSTLDATLQRNVNNLVHLHNIKLRTNEVHNAAVIVMDVHTGKTLAYCGNTTPLNNHYHQNHVDVIQARRSTGSILKPLLFAAALQDGELLPSKLVADVPTYYKNFAPKNYSRTYEGAIRANEALSRSLNIPSVQMLHKYDVGRFCNILNNCGFTTIKQSADHYGLSLILGGAEATLFELCGVYASMARCLHNYTNNNSTYYKNEFNSPIVEDADTLKRGTLSEHYPVFSASAIFSTFEALTGVARPKEEMGWEMFSSSRKIAWKTGTSFGYRDAWAIGITSNYVVAVWIGNANGEGRPGIIGGSTAGPLMFDVFRYLPTSQWFEPPYDDMVEAAICSQSGYKAGEFCTVDSAYIPTQGNKSKLCPYHKLVHLDKTENFRVNADCYPISQIKHKSYFVLSPVEEWYFIKNNPLYKKLPPMHPNCKSGKDAPMEFIYPQSSNKIYLPKDIDGEVHGVVLKVAHRNTNSKIYWHLDGEYIGETENIHHKSITPNIGYHRITLTDSDGNILHKTINCVGRGDK